MYLCALHVLIMVDCVCACYDLVCVVCMLFYMMSCGCVMFGLCCSMRMHVHINLCWFVVYVVSCLRWVLYVLCDVACVWFDMFAYRCVMCVAQCIHTCMIQHCHTIAAVCTFMGTASHVTAHRLICLC